MGLNDNKYNPLKLWWRDDINTVQGLVEGNRKFFKKWITYLFLIRSGEAKHISTYECGFICASYLSFQNTFTPGMCRGLVDMCLNIQSEDKDSSGQCWLTDDMIKALILDVIGAGNQRWKQGAGVLSAETFWLNILSFSMKTYILTLYRFW